MLGNTSRLGLITFLLLFMAICPSLGQAVVANVPVAELPGWPPLKPPDGRTACESGCDSRRPVSRARAEDDRSQDRPLGRWCWVASAAESANEAWQRPVAKATDSRFSVADATDSGGAECATQTVGTGSAFYEYHATCCGNAYLCTKGARLTLIEQYLSLEYSQSLSFIVAESRRALEGDYHKLYESTVSSSYGRKWYSSGPVSVHMKIGHYYAVAAGHSGLAYEFWDPPTHPVPTVFGQSVSGYWNDYPITYYGAYGYTDAASYQRVTACLDPRAIGISQPSQSWYEPGESVQVNWVTSGADWVATDRIKLEYSTDSGTTWSRLPGAESLPYNAGTFSWNTTASPFSEHYRLRASYVADPTIFDTTDDDTTVAPDTTPPTIYHTPMQDVGLTAATTYKISATIYDQRPLDYVTLYWNKNGGEFQSVPMPYSGNYFDGYSAAIPGPGQIGDRYCYYIEARDSSAAHNISRYPATAPDDKVRFNVSACNSAEIEASPAKVTWYAESACMRGNIIRCDRGTELTQIEHYMQINTSSELRFVVYECATSAGTYRKVFENTVAASGTGTKFYSSGPISINLKAGRYYFIGAAWKGAVYPVDLSNPTYAPCTIGQVLGQNGPFSGYPPPATFVSAPLNPRSLDQRLSTCHLHRSLELLQPNGGQSYQPGNAVTISWDYPGYDWPANPTVKLEYSLDSGASWNTVAGAESLSISDGSFNWNTSGLGNSDHYRVRVACNEDANISDASDSDFSVIADFTPPAIAHTPLADTSLTSQRVVNATVTDEHGVASVSLFWSRNGEEFNTAVMSLSGGQYSATIPGGVAGDSFRYYIEARDSSLNTNVARHPATGYNQYVIYPRPDYLTEEFYSPGFDLQNTRIIFTPDGSRGFYSACRDYCSSLPTDPAGGTPVSLPNDGFVRVSLSDGALVSLFGTPRSDLYIGSNGYITFDAGDSSVVTYSYTHFQKPRITALGYNLDPSSGGTVSWKQTTDRIAVSFLGVPSSGSPSQVSTFQIELFYDGRISLAYLGVGVPTYTIAGLSAGTGKPADFISTDISAYQLCSPASIAVTDSIPAEDDLSMPYGSVPVGGEQQESVSLCNTGSGTLKVSRARVGYYAQEFSSDPVAGWQATSDADWSVVDGEYRLYRPSPASSYTLTSTYVGATFDDAYCETRMRWAVPNTGYQGLILRASTDLRLNSPYAGSGYVLAISGDRSRLYLILTKYSAGVAKGLASAYVSNVYTSPATIGLSATGPVLKCYLNGALVATATDTDQPLTAGCIGLAGTVTSNYVQTYYFDDVFVSAPLDWPSSGFHLRNPAGFPAFVGPGETLSIGVDYAPCVAGGSTAMLSIDCKGGTSDNYRLSLSGTGHSAFSAAEAKVGTDGTGMTMAGKRVSAAWPGIFYVQEEDRSSGIGIMWTGTSPKTGDLVTVTGRPSTNGTERIVQADSVGVNVSPASAPRPLYVTNWALGGSDFPSADIASAFGQKGVTNGFGLNNIGLLVRTSGRITFIGDGYLYIDDGSSLANGDGQPVGVRVKCTAAGYTLGQYIAVTGVAGSFDDGCGRVQRLVLTRAQSDVKLLP